MSTRPQHRGFSLVELMITVAILAIISIIAYPSYQSLLIDNRRVEAQSALLAFASAMQRYKTDNRTFANAQNGTGLPNPPKNTVFPSQAPLEASDKFYNLTIHAAGTNNYTLRATPISGTAQEDNGFLELTHTGIKRWDRNNNGAIDSGETGWSD